MLLPTNDLIENSPCTFQGNMPDADDCQCRKRKSQSELIYLLFFSLFDM